MKIQNIFKFTSFLPTENVCSLFRLTFNIAPIFFSIEDFYCKKCIEVVLRLFCWMNNWFHINLTIVRNSYGVYWSKNWAINICLNCLWKQESLLLEVPSSFRGVFCRWSKVLSHYIKRSFIWGFIVCSFLYVAKLKMKSKWEWHQSRTNNCNFFSFYWKRCQEAKLRKRQGIPAQISKQTTLTSV